MRLHVNFSVMTPLFAPILLELQRHHGVTAYSGFVYGRDDLKEVESFGVDTTHVRTFSPFLGQFDVTKAPDLEYLARLERDLGDPNFALIIAADRTVSQFDFARARRIMEAGFRLIEQLFDEFQPDAVLSDGVACIMSYVQFALARRRGIPFYVLSASRITDRFYVTRSYLERYERVEAFFDRYKKQGLPPAVRERAEAYVDRFRRDRVQPEYFHKWAKPPAVDVKSLRILWSVMQKYYSPTRDRDNYLLVRPTKAIAGRVARLAKAFLFDPRHFEQPRDGEKFIFFPLHYQPESSTLVWAPFYVDQIAAVENIAKALPVDHKLYVKEHKASLGRRPRGYYARLRAIPNVRLIDPYVNSHTLIRTCSAACVLTSTVGWEAILYEKPVISLGEAFFNAFDLVRHVRAVADLPSVFQDVVTNFQPDYELLLKFVAANLDGLYTGDADYLPGVSGRDIGRDRIECIAAVLAAELGLPQGAAA
ncbi:MAG TPA: hypothetical protein VFA59_01335 [Vicinamibacterales bacterium]|nr:hypothetical protein [Vicinamibacterales bacterium]